MDMDRFYGHLVRGELPIAVDLLKDDSEQGERLGRYLERFAVGKTEPPPVEGIPGALLVAYQVYYRQVFWLGHDRDVAARALADRLALVLGLGDDHPGLEELEAGPVAAAFATVGYLIQAGRTGGYYGPYIWRDTEVKRYAVGLPDGVEEYTVKLLDGFISRSWLDYLSFGQVGTGGWTDGDGIINCIRSAYELEGEDFTVSLLKHEAQHVRDLRWVKNMSPADLEYRAKLVELIYSRERNLLPVFLRQAGASKACDGHTLGAKGIARDFASALACSEEELLSLPVERVQSVAGELFVRSNRDISIRYGINEQGES